jgi:hypothetical protein
MIMGKEKTIPILAMIVLLIGIGSTIFVQASQSNSETIKIYGQEYSIDNIFKIAEKRTITTDEGEITGIALDDLIIKIGSVCTNCEYTFKSKDGYQQTVPWDFMQKGVLTDYNRVYFPDTAHSFWVRDIIEIEVN